MKLAARLLPLAVVLLAACSSPAPAQPDAPASSSPEQSTPAVPAPAPSVSLDPLPPVAGPAVVEPSPAEGVHPGAFCHPAGGLGYTVDGRLMRCEATQADSRLRWRAA